MTALNIYVIKLLKSQQQTYAKIEIDKLYPISDKCYFKQIT